MKKNRTGPVEGLLFYLSEDAAGITPAADFAMGEQEPRGRFYKAPGNVYAERGTFSFFFRTGEDAENHIFPLITVSFADGTAWDRAFLRIDFNGKSRSIDAFVTDNHQKRLSVRSTLHPFPTADEWVSVAFSWDENIGIRLYVNGILYGEERAAMLLSANLGLLGTHAFRFCSVTDERVKPYEFTGEIRDIRIFDRMLSDANMAELSRGASPASVPTNSRSLYDPSARAEWDARMGWDTRINPPQIYAGDLSVRKVNVKDAFDKERPVPSVLSGIPEFSWPEGGETEMLLPHLPDGPVLPGRKLSDPEGRSLMLSMPDEPWNHFEITGAAFGTLTLIDGKSETVFDTKQRYQEHSVYELKTPLKGKKIRFDNQLPDENIIDFSACLVKSGSAPKDVKRIDTFYIDANTIEPERLSDAALYVARYVNWRYLGDERNICIGLKKPVRYNSIPAGLPIANILIPYANKSKDGLDGIEMTIPAMRLMDTVGGCFNVNIRIHDPLWQSREMMNFTFRMRAGEPKKIWFDLRDRILPDNRILYITFTASAADFKSDLLQNMLVKLYFKPLKEALVEHIEDRTREVLNELSLILTERHPDPSELTFRRLFLSSADVLRYDPGNAAVKEALFTALSLSERHPSLQDLSILREYHTQGTVYGVTVEKPEPKVLKVPDWAEEWAVYQADDVREKGTAGFKDRFVLSSGEDGLTAEEQEILKQETGSASGIADWSFEENERINFLPEEVYRSCEANRINSREILPAARIRFESEDDAKTLPFEMMAQEDEIRLYAFNVSGKTVRASLRGLKLLPGTWRVRTGVCENHDRKISGKEKINDVYFENFREIPVEFPGKSAFLLEMHRITAAIPYKMRPELEISREGLKVTGKAAEVVVRNCGAFDTPETEIALFGPDGKEIARKKVPALAGSRLSDDGDCFSNEINRLSKDDDILPKDAKIRFAVPNIGKGCRFILDPDEKIFEITKKNNIIGL